MILQIINQESIEVSSDQAKKLMAQIVGGTEMVVIGGEMVKASAIMGIRNSLSGENLTVRRWGELPSGALDHFYDERREALGDGYKKYQAMRNRLLLRRRA